MRAQKFAISIPAETMSQVDVAARRLGMTRSRYIATVLAHIAKRERDLAVSARVDAVLEQIDQQDLETAAHLLAARRDAGTVW